MSDIAELIARLEAQAVTIANLERERDDLHFRLVKTDRDLEGPRQKFIGNRRIGEFFGEEDCVTIDHHVNGDAVRRATTLGRGDVAKLFEVVIGQILQEARKEIDVAQLDDGNTMMRLIVLRQRYSIAHHPHTEFVRQMLRYG